MRGQVQVQSLQFAATHTHTPSDVQEFHRPDRIAPHSPAQHAKGVSLCRCGVGVAVVVSGVCVRACVHNEQRQSHLLNYCVLVAA